MPQAPAWADNYVGIPYHKRGRNRTGPGLDCWGVLMAVLDDRAGIKVPGFEELGYEGREGARSLAQFMDRHLGDGMAWTEVWRRTGQGPMPCPGVIREFDGLRLRMDGQPLHVGVAVGNGWFLHTEQGINCMLEEVEDPKWTNRINGVYRWQA